MTKTTGKREPHMRWSPAEWRLIAAHALPLIEGGRDGVAATLEVQRDTLPHDRHKARADLDRYATRQVFQKFLAEVKAMSAAQRAALPTPTVRAKYARSAYANPPPPVESQPAPVASKPTAKAPAAFDAEAARYTLIDRGYRGQSRWTSRERMLIARQVFHWQQCGDGRPLHHLIIDAQELVLPENRRRANSGIKQDSYKGAAEEWIKEALSNLWQIKGTPFDHTAQAPSLGGGILPGFVDDADEPKTAPTAEPATTPAPQTTPTQAQEAPQAPQTAPPAPVAPLVNFAAGNGPIAEAMRVFVDTMTGALGTLLSAQANHLLGQVQVSLAEHSRLTAVNVAALIERGMQNAVHQMVGHELGGPVVPPGNPQAAPLANGDASGPHADTPKDDTPDAHQSAPHTNGHANGRIPCLRVDVVGIEQGDQRARVREAFEEAGNVDIRFIGPTANAWKPHASRHVILVTSRIPHQLGNTIKKAGVSPILVNRTPGHVIHAIEELQRAAGFAAAH